MNVIPDDVANQLVDVVYKEADRVGYLTFTKPQSAAFMEALVQMPTVGGVLLNYMERAAVKTYVKDSILHDYTDKKKAGQVPTADELLDWCKKKLAMPDLMIVENIDKAWTKIMLFVSHTAKQYVLVADGSYKQWGIAVQKALTYRAGKPFASKEGYTTQLVLSLYCKGTPVSHVEKVALTKALEYLHGHYRFYGES